MWWQPCTWHTAHIWNAPAPGAAQNFHAAQVSALSTLLFFPGAWIKYTALSTSSRHCLAKARLGVISSSNSCKVLLFFFT